VADDEKLKEFRETNIRLTKERDDLTKERDALKTEVDGLKGRLGEVDTLKGQLAARDAELATERAAKVEAQQKADRGRLRDTLRNKVAALGALPAAVDILVDKAEPFFQMDGDVVKAKANIFSPTQPGVPLTTEEWLTNAVKELSFLFAPSVGGGAPSRTSAGGGTGSGVPVLKDPTPQQLGERAADIKAGKLRVEYSS
jgi:hypothetical protein